MTYDTSLRLQTQTNNISSCLVYNAWNLIYGQELTQTGRLS